MLIIYRSPNITGGRGHRIVPHRKAPQDLLGTCCREASDVAFFGANSSVFGEGDIFLGFLSWWLWLLLNITHLIRVNHLQLAISHSNVEFPDGIIMYYTCELLVYNSNFQFLALPQWIPVDPSRVSPRQSTLPKNCWPCCSFGPVSRLTCDLKSCHAAWMGRSVGVQMVLDR